MLASKEAELVAIYGRRRVGKTFLIREWVDKLDVFERVTKTRKKIILTLVSPPSRTPGHGTSSNVS